MVERRPLEETGGKRESILAREFVEGVLSAAQENLGKDGYLTPMLFLQFDFGERMVIPLELPDTTEEKQLYFSALGSAIRRVGKRINEALSLTETWFVTNEDETLDVSPSEHPARKEAISIIGRDREGKQAAVLLQPFSRDLQNRLIFEPPKFEQYNELTKRRVQPVGLLDYLFVSPASRRRKSRWN